MIKELLKDCPDRRVIGGRASRRYRPTVLEKLPKTFLLPLPRDHYFGWDNHESGVTVPVSKRQLRKC